MVATAETETRETRTTAQDSTFDMKTDPRIIYHFIQSQAGSHGKAFMELVQNSIDAGATYVKVNLSQTDFWIEDNGAGFGTANDIHRNFGTFGTPHEEGDSRFGRFRLGRGQIMAFAKTVWHTPGHIMKVDVKNNGLNYELIPGPSRKGVRIEGTFYKPVDGDNPYYQKIGAELDRAIREVTDLVKYSDVPVYINGERVSKDPKKMKWDFEDEYAYYDFKPSGEFVLYNMGFYVRDYPAKTYGSAVVVTKSHLKLNMARNQVIEVECPVWKKVTSVLKKNMAKGPKLGRLTDESRAFMSRSLRLGEIELSDARDLRLITLVTGVTLTIGGMVDNLIYTSRSSTPLAKAEKGHALGQQVHSASLAYVVSDTTLGNFDAKTVEEFRQTIAEILRRDQIYYNRAESWLKLPITTVYEAGKAFTNGSDGEFHILDEKALTPTEKAALRTLEYINQTLLYKIQAALNWRNIQPRKLLAGTSGTAVAWTDGDTFIAFNKTLLNSARHGIAGWVQIVNTFVHEYLHTDDDWETSYVHSNDFYETLNQVLSHEKLDPNQSVYHVVDMALRYYLSLMQKGERQTKAQKVINAITETAQEFEDAA